MSKNPAQPNSTLSLEEEKNTFGEIIRKSNIQQKEIPVSVSLVASTHQGKLQIGETTLTAYVLENGVRIISQSSIFRAFGRTKRGRSKDDQRVLNRPSFIDANNLQAFINKDLEDVLTIIEFKDKRGTVRSGYDASILPKLCKVYLDARASINPSTNRPFLLPSQDILARASEILLLGLSNIGIIALVDEATGYQGDRQKDELQKILSAYISKELLPWQKRFPNEYYEQICRLRGWNFDPLSQNRPQIIGKITNQIVYQLFPDQILDELKKLNPPNDSGNRPHRFHQYLTLDIGNVNLERHLAQVIVLMRISKTWAEFEDKLYEAFPRYGYPEKLF
jgi:P63C domain